jgi:hypothetical protein
MACISDLYCVQKQVMLTTRCTETANTLGVDGSQVGVLEQRDEVSLSGLLKSHDGRGLESKIRLEVLGDLTNETLEAGGEEREEERRE